MRNLAVALLVLFPLFILFNTPLAFAMLFAAIVVFYFSNVKRASASVRKARAKAPAPQPEWKDPWNTDGVGQ